MEVSSVEGTDFVQFLPPLNFLGFLSRRLSSSSSREKSAPVTANKTCQTEEVRCEDFSSQTDLPDPSQPAPSVSSVETQTSSACSGHQIFRSNLAERTEKSQGDNFFHPNVRVSGLVPNLLKTNFDSKSGSDSGQVSCEEVDTLNDNNFPERQTRDKIIQPPPGRDGENKIASIIPENVDIPDIACINNEDMIVDSDLLSFYDDFDACCGTSDTAGFGSYDGIFQPTGYSAILKQPNISTIKKINMEQTVSSSKEKNEETDGQNNKKSVSEHNPEAGSETVGKAEESGRTPKNVSKVAGTKKSWDEKLRGGQRSAEKASAPECTERKPGSCLEQEIASYLFTGQNFPECSGVVEPLISPAGVGGCDYTSSPSQEQNISRQSLIVSPKPATGVALTSSVLGSHQSPHNTTGSEETDMILQLDRDKDNGVQVSQRRVARQVAVEAAGDSAEQNMTHQASVFNLSDESKQTGFSVIKQLEKKKTVQASSENIEISNIQVSEDETGIEKREGDITPVSKSERLPLIKTKNMSSSENNSTWFEGQHEVENGETNLRKYPRKQRRKASISPDSPRAKKSKIPNKAVITGKEPQRNESSKEEREIPYEYEETNASRFMESEISRTDRQTKSKSHHRSSTDIKERKEVDKENDSNRNNDSERNSSETKTSRDSRKEKSLKYSSDECTLRTNRRSHTKNEKPKTDEKRRTDSKFQPIPASIPIKSEMKVSMTLNKSPSKVVKLGNTKPQTKGQESKEKKSSDKESERKVEKSSAEKQQPKVKKFASKERETIVAPKSPQKSVMFKGQMPEANTTSDSKEDFALKGYFNKDHKEPINAANFGLTRSPFFIFDNNNSCF